MYFVEVASCHGARAGVIFVTPKVYVLPHIFALNESA